MTDPREKFRQVLINKQQEARLSGAAFARKCGVRQSLWWSVQRGDKRVGPKLMAGAVRAFPELAPDAMAFFMSTITSQEVLPKECGAA